MCGWQQRVLESFLTSVAVIIFHVKEKNDSWNIFQFNINVIPVENPFQCQDQQINILHSSQEERQWPGWLLETNESRSKRIKWFALLLLSSAGDRDHLSFNPIIARDSFRHLVLPINFAFYSIRGNLLIYSFSRVVSRQHLTRLMNRCVQPGYRFLIRSTFTIQFL